MKWVKASERLPKDDGIYVCKTDYLTFSLRYISIKDGCGATEAIIEWLDESPIKEDGEDELWDDLKAELSTIKAKDFHPVGIAKLLKSKFHITKTQNQ